MQILRFLSRSTCRRSLLAVAVLGLVLVPCPGGAADEFIPPSDPLSPDAPPRMSASEAAETMQLPPGYRVSVFSAEPDVQNPIAAAWDGRGRLWVAENYTYAERTQRFDMSLRDRIIILDDRDGDGRADERRVFSDELQVLSSVELGRDGVWAMCPPQLLFIPDRDHDDVPDGPAEVRLDGFVVAPENYHTFANGLRWGPDGWLYGRCGASCPGRIGPPGTPNERRVPIFGGIWRYHPDSQRFEVLCHGTTNPWGHDWNRRGEAFFINTVNGHLWHVMPGAHFARPHSIDPNPQVYELIDQHADHYHWDTGQNWTDSRSASGEHDRLGGGHAHVGAMIYLGDNWPAELHDQLFTLNLHGRRANRDRLERHGSGYVGRHKPDLFQVRDPWFRGMELTYGPDGGVYVLDWSDTGECHEHDGVHRTSGRIYKITYGEPARVEVDIRAASDAQLLAWQTHDNEWFVRQARQELSRRRPASSSLAHELRAQFAAQTDEVLRLRALWALVAVQGVERELLNLALQDRSEHVRAWAVRLLTDDWQLDTIFGPLPVAVDKNSEPLPVRWPSEHTLAQLCGLAETDESGLVQLVLTSTLQRLPVPLRGRLATSLVRRAEFADDHNLPLLAWYGLLPLADPQADPLCQAHLVDVLKECQWPRLRQSIVRRLAESIRDRPQPVAAVLNCGIAARREDLQQDILSGMRLALRGVQRAPRPANWDDFLEVLPPALAESARDLDALFGGGRALEELRTIALDDKSPLEVRRAALEALITSQPPELRAVCEQLLSVRYLNTTAVRGLAGFDDPALGTRLAKAYRSFAVIHRPAVLETLASRPAFATALLDEIAAGKIPKTDLTPYFARQIAAFGDSELLGKLERVWGSVRDTSADRRQAIEALRDKLTGFDPQSADAARGRVQFAKVCGNCHTLYGHGGKLGPDLTGSGRHNLNYLLENTLDPSAVVTADFRVSTVEMQDGRILTGVVLSQNAELVTLQTPTEQLRLPRPQIEQIRPSQQSLMPDGLLDRLSDAEIRDLFAYLMSPAQVPLP